MNTEFSLENKLVQAACTLAKSDLFDSEQYQTINSLNLDLTDPIWHYVTTGFSNNLQVSHNSDKQKLVESTVLTELLARDDDSNEVAPRETYEMYKNYLNTDLSPYFSSDIGSKLYSILNTIRIDILFLKEYNSSGLSFIELDETKINVSKNEDKKENKITYTLEAKQNSSVKFKSSDTTQIKIYVRGPNFLDDANQRIPIYVNYVDITISNNDNQSLFEEKNIKQLWHDRKKTIGLNLTKDTTYTLFFSYFPNMYTKAELLHILKKKNLTTA